MSLQAAGSCLSFVFLHCSVPLTRTWLSKSSYNHPSAAMEIAFTIMHYKAILQKLRNSCFYLFEHVKLSWNVSTKPVSLIINAFNFHSNIVCIAPWCYVLADSISFCTSLIKFYLTKSWTKHICFPIYSSMCLHNIWDSKMFFLNGSKS